MGKIPSLRARLCQSPSCTQRGGPKSVVEGRAQWLRWDLRAKTRCLKRLPGGSGDPLDVYSPTWTCGALHGWTYSSLSARGIYYALWSPVRGGTPSSSIGTASAFSNKLRRTKFEKGLAYKAADFITDEAARKRKEAEVAREELKERGKREKKEEKEEEAAEIWRVQQSKKERRLREAAEKKARKSGEVSLEKTRSVIEEQSVEGNVDENGKGQERKEEQTINIEGEGVDIETGGKEGESESESEESKVTEERWNEHVSERVKQLKHSLLDCLNSEDSTVSRGDSRFALECFAGMEELLNEERRRTSALEGRFGECSEEKGHLRMVLASKVVLNTRLEEAPSSKGIRQEGLPLGQDRRTSQAHGACMGSGVQQPMRVPRPSFALIVEQPAASVREARSGGVVINLPSAAEKELIKMSDMPPEKFHDKVRAVAQAAGRGPDCESLAVKERDRVCVGMMACRFAGYERVRRCFACMGYGHVLKDCKGKKLCRRCGSDEH
ncbi:hypothetical protein QAD02_003736 [Eretmocerus hayati]|uniref:Uncharacterized protein n=1 Tax=Eretmocerus hayati TaxID=131215 RepID=A0ACC2NQF3_9HYME|nr:hypothetical protein QAD02_003736 [Eretmocerus hayati]